jgi:hypothetical protein
MGKKDKKAQVGGFAIGDGFDPEQEVSLSFSAGELSLIHHLLVDKFQECEVLYNAGDRSTDNGLTGKFSVSAITKIEPILQPLAEWVHQEHEHEHH